MSSYWTMTTHNISPVDPLSVDKCGGGSEGGRGGGSGADDGGGEAAAARAVAVTAQPAMLDGECGGGECGGGDGADGDGLSTTR